MAGKSKYLTDKERDEARQLSVARYNASAKRLATARRYGTTEKAKEAQRRYRQGLKYDERRESYSPNQLRAWTAIRYAVKSGKIERPTICQECGGQRRIEAHHHNGYERLRWLDVRWLCGECHVAAHAKYSRH